MRPVGTLDWEFADGTRRETAAYSQLNILGHAEMSGFTLPQACGGQAECGTCRVRILAGTVTDMTGDEVELRSDHPGHFDQEERLACRARPCGDVAIRLRSRAPADLREV